MNRGTGEDEEECVPVAAVSRPQTARDEGDGRVARAAVGGDAAI